MAKLLTVEEVRDRLGLRSAHTVYRWAQEGRLPRVVLSARSVRFLAEDIDAFIARHRDATKG